MTRADDNKRIPNWGIGVLAIVITLFGFYLAFAKSIPFFDKKGYEVKAVFSDAQNLRLKSPVRVAGVDVGKVTAVEHLKDENGDGVDAAVITMELEEDARPIHEDATMAIRPRLFLEGNLFVDLHPGSPGADELESGDVLPLGQTQISVQFDQVLTTLQKPVRTDLQVFLKEFGDALDRYGGAEGFREQFRTSPAAFRYTAEVNEAFLGTEPGDLSGLIVNLDRLVRALDRNEVQLQELITNLRIVTGSFAAEADSLERGIAELPRLLAAGRPALARLNTAFPALRAFAREAIPGVRAANRNLPEATRWIGQLRRLVSKRELRGLVADLRPTIPKLARLAKASIPFFEETRALSSCFNLVVIPWSNTPVPAIEEMTDYPVYKNTGYGLTGLAGESRSGDAQGEWFRVLGGGGTNTVSIPTSDTGPAAGVVPFALDSADPAVSGAQPSKQSSAKTPFRPDVACETQDPPNLASSSVPGPTTASASETSPTPAGTRVEELSQEYAEIYMKLIRADALRQAGAVNKAEALTRLANQLLVQWNKTKLPEYRQAVSRMGLGG